MGAVYEGEDAALKRKVAVKFLPEELLKQPDVIERFMREAQVAGGLNHPNIIAVYDVGKDERGCYMVIELLNPKSASSRIKTEGPYHWIVATRIIADCAAALSIAHENGIIHRDIKPDEGRPEPPRGGIVPRPRRVWAGRGFHDGTPPAGTAYPPA
jgi:serine/threonine-protein kinase